jgi:hypothetical protein
MGGVAIFAVIGLLVYLWRRKVGKLREMEHLPAEVLVREEPPSYAERDRDERHFCLRW